MSSFHPSPLPRVIRQQQLEKHEREMQEKIESAERERLMRERQQEQEKRLAKEMEKLKWEEQRDQRRRQQLKENR